MNKCSHTLSWRLSTLPRKESPSTRITHHHKRTFETHSNPNSRLSQGTHTQTAHRERSGAKGRHHETTSRHGTQHTTHTAQNHTTATIEILVVRVRKTAVFVRLRLAAPRLAAPRLVMSRGPWCAPLVYSYALNRRAPAEKFPRGSLLWVWAARLPPTKRKTDFSYYLGGVTLTAA